MHTCFVQEGHKGMLLRGPILQVHVANCGNLKGDESLQVGKYFISHFNKCHVIVQPLISEESQLADESAMDVSSKSEIYFR